MHSKLVDSQHDQNVAACHGTGCIPPDHGENLQARQHESMAGAPKAKLGCSHSCAEAEKRGRQQGSSQIQTRRSAPPRCPFAPVYSCFSVVQLPTPNGHTAGAAAMTWPVKEICFGPGSISSQHPDRSERSFPMRTCFIFKHAVLNANCKFCGRRRRQDFLRAVNIRGCGTLAAFAAGANCHARLVQGGTCTCIRLVFFPVALQSVPCLLQCLGWWATC